MSIAFLVRLTFRGDLEPNVMIHSEYRIAYSVSAEAHSLLSQLSLALSKEQILKKE